MILIEKDKAIDALNDNFTINDARDAVTVQQYIFRVCTRLKNLPSAQRKGRWIIKETPGTEWYRVTCSACGEDVSSVIPTIGFFPNVKALWDFCPNCGADMNMIGEEDG